METKKSVVRIVISPKQKEILKALNDSEHTEIFAGGAAGGSKSFTGCLWVITSALQYPGSRWFIARARLKTLKESTLLTFWEVCRMMDLKKDVHYLYNANSNVVTFIQTKSEVYLKDLFLYPSDPDFIGLGSTEFTGGFIDEMGEITEQAYNIMKSRCRFKLEEFNRIPKIFMGSNPCKTFIYREFYRKWKNDDLESHKMYIPASVYDNPFISDQYIELLKQLDPVNRARLLDGNWEYDDDPGIMFEYDKINRMFREPLKLEGEFFTSCDVARFGRDLAVIGLWQGLHLKKLYVYDKSSSKFLREKHEQIEENFHVVREHQVIDEDGVGCLTVNSDLLTTEGFVSVNDLVVGMSVFSKDVNGFLCVEKIIGVNVSRDVKVLNVNGFEFSRGHIVPIKSRKNYFFKNEYWEDVVKRKGFYLDTGSENNFDVNSDFVFSETVYNMPNGGSKKCGNGLIINSVLFASFLGWFVSEGNIDGFNVCISQSEKSLYNKDINDLLVGMGVKFHVKRSLSGELSYVFSHKNLSSWLRKECYTCNSYKSWNKKAPSFLFSSGKKVIISFLDSFIKGDGYVHKGANCYVSSSKKLCDDIQGLKFLKGENSTISIKQVKGSESNIFGRVIVRKRDVYQVYERKTKNDFYVRPVVVNEKYDKVYNVKISGVSKLFVTRNNCKCFWTHNGGLVDEHLGCKGFVNNSKQLVPPDEDYYQDTKRTNYSNLRAQCYFKLSELVRKELVTISSNINVMVKNRIVEELEQIRRADVDKDSPLKIVGKDVIKENIGRSPDFADMLMMRMYFELSRFTGIGGGLEI